MSEFISWALGIALTVGMLLFVFKLYFDRRAARRGVAGYLAAPGRSAWITFFGFIVALALFPAGAALSLNIGFFELYRFWDPALLAGDEPFWFASCLFGGAILTILLFFLAHLPKHRKHLPWYAWRK